MAGLLSFFGAPEADAALQRGIFNFVDAFPDNRERRRREEALKRQQLLQDEELAYTRKQRGLLDQQQAAQQAAQQRRMSYLDSVSPSSGPAMPVDPAAALMAGISPQEMALLDPKQKTETPFAKINPADYTPESVQQFLSTGNYGVLKPRAPTPNPTADMQNYQQAKAEGYKGSFTDYQKEIRKASAQNITLPSQRFDIKTGEGVAGQVGPMLKATREQALSGIKLIDSAQRISNAVASGNVIAGPAAQMRLRVAQAADLLGIGGASNAEKIKNTRDVVRGMAEQGVAARSQLGGQAQISNAEQELLTRATAGDISDLTVSEVAQIAEINKRLGRQLYEQHQVMLQGLDGVPDTQNLRPFFAVPPMPGAGSADAPRVRRWNPQTRRLED